MGLAIAFLQPANAQHHLTTAQLADFQKTCGHYQNRARFQPRGPDQTMAATLADSCTIAMRELDTPKARAGEAITYLTRLTELRREVVALQLAGYRREHGAYGTARYSRRIAYLPEASEYLIAHRLGVIDAFRTWSEGGEFETVFRY